MRYTRKRIPSIIPKKTFKNKSRVYAIDVFPDLYDLRHGTGITKSALNKYEKSHKLFENSSVCSFNRVKEGKLKAQCESHINFIKGRRGMLNTDLETILRYQIPTQRYRDTSVRILKNIILYIHYISQKKAQPSVLVTTHPKRISHLFHLPNIKDGALFLLEYDRRNYWTLSMLHSGVRTLESSILNPKNTLDNMKPQTIYIPINKRHGISSMSIYFVSSGLSYHKVSQAANITRNNKIFTDCPLITKLGNNEIINLRSIVICNKIRSNFIELQKKSPKEGYITTTNTFFKNLNGVLTQYSEVKSQPDKKKKIDKILGKLSSYIETFMGSHYQVLVNAIYSTQTHGEGQIEKLAEILIKNIEMSRINREWYFLTSHMQRAIHTSSIVISKMIENDVFIPDSSFDRILKQLKRNMGINSRHFGEWLREYVISKAKKIDDNKIDD